MKYNNKSGWIKQWLLIALVGLFAVCGEGVCTAFLPGAVVASAAQNSLSKTALTICKGERATLTVKGSYKKVTWSVDNKAVATVTSKGVVRGISAGNAVVTADVDGTKYKCTVTVEAPRLNKTKLTENVGNTYQLTVSGTERKVTYKSSDPSVVKVSSKGKLSFLKPGSGKVTATIGGAKLTCTVRVATPSIALPLQMEIGEERGIDLSGTQYKGISFASSDPSVVFVNVDGLLRANQPGSAQISVKIADYEYVGQVKVRNSFSAAVKYGVYDGLNEQDTKIAKKAHEVLELAVTDDMEAIEKIKAVHDYIVLNTAYDTTYSKFSVANTLLDGSSVCQGYAETMKLFLDALEIENQLIYGTSNGEAHVWNLVNLEDSWYHLDVTWDDPLDQTGRDMPGYVRYEYFMLQDAAIAKDHIWSREKYPKAAGGVYEDYIAQKLAEQFKAEGLFAQNEEEFTQLAVQCAVQGKYEVTILYAGDASSWGNLGQLTANALSKALRKSSRVGSQTQRIGEYLQVTLVMTLY